MLNVIRALRQTSLFVLSRIQTAWWMHPCGHHHAHARTHTHANDCTFAVWESGDARRLKKGAICRAMASTPCAWEYRWGYIYTHTHTHTRTHHSLFPIHFLPPRRIFYRGVFLLTRVWRGALPLVRQPQILFSFTLRVRHPASCGARRFLFQIFSISMKGETRVDWLVYEWNGAISHAEAVKQYISRYRTQYTFIEWYANSFMDAGYVLSAMNSLTNLNIPSLHYNGKK